jgi:GTP:adenosylcobinamide-phosphate guanylyltransferase
MEPAAALVLAGRRGPDDPFARSRGASHRALLEVAGVPMLLRVVHALRAARNVASVCVSIDLPEVLDTVPALAAWRRDGSLALHQSLDSPARSVADALRQIGAGRVLVTTADHALLSGSRVDAFLAAAAATGADLAVGVVERGAFREHSQSAARTWVRLRGGAYTGANLFAFQTPRAARAAEFFARAERHRKRPWRMLAALGPGLGLGYLAGTLDLDAVFAHVSRRVDATLRPVCIDDPRAAIDIDKPADLALAEEILAKPGHHG